MIFVAEQNAIGYSIKSEHKYICVGDICCVVCVATVSGVSGYTYYWVLHPLHGLVTLWYSAVPLHIRREILT